MSVGTFRRSIRDFLAMQPQGPLAAIDSLSAIHDDDAPVTNRYILLDILEDSTMIERGMSKVEHDMEISGDPSSAQARISWNEGANLHKNLKIVIGDYLRLGSDAKLGFAEEQRAVENVKHLPEVMNQLAEYHGAALKNPMPDEQKAHILLDKLYACTCSTMAKTQLRQLEGSGRSPFPKPSDN